LSLASLLNKVVTVQRPIVTKDASGGATRNFADVDGQAEVPCSIQPVSDQERIRFASRQLQVTHSVYFARDLDLERADVLYEPATERTFVVTSWQNQAGRDRVWRATVREQLD
jgi:head-tail adaptor